MPELPEIETVKLQLNKVLRGAVLQSIKVLSLKIVQGDINSLVGKKALGFERKGKVLLIDFGKGQKLGFHFKMTGQLIYDDGKTRIVGGHPSEDLWPKCRTRTPE